MQEIINFSVGGHRISVEILKILVTEKFEKAPTQVPSNDPTLLGVMNYQGVSVPVYDLSLILDGVTGRTRVDDLIALLEAREQDHVDWLAALQTAIRNSTEFTGARDPRQCAFGAWYDGFSSENQDLMHILKQFNEPHRKFHSLADELLSLARTDGKEAALDALQHNAASTLAALRRLFQAARETLVSSYKPVVVYTTDNGSRPNVAFVVDALEDALAIEDQDIKLFSRDSDSPFRNVEDSSELVVGLITKNNINSLLIEPNRLQRDYN